MSERLEHPDLEHADSVEFDWSALERAMGETEPMSPEAKFADALGRILRWLSVPLVEKAYAHTPGGARLNLVGRRATVALWVLHPEAFPECTLERIAHRAGVQPERLHELSAEFSRLFKVRNRLQVSRAPSVAARRVKAKKMQARKAGPR